MEDGNSLSTLYLVIPHWGKMGTLPVMLMVEQVSGREVGVSHRTEWKEPHAQRHGVRVSQFGASGGKAESSQTGELEGSGS